MRRFFREVFKGAHDTGATPRYTSSEVNELLGSAEKLVVQYRAIKIDGTTPTLSLELQGSDNGVDWTNLEYLFSAEALTAGVVNTRIATSTADIPAFARLALTMAGTYPSAEIQLFVCGRDRVS